MRKSDYGRSAPSNILSHALTSTCLLTSSGTSSLETSWGSCTPASKWRTHSMEVRASRISPVNNNPRPMCYECRNYKKPTFQRMGPIRRYNICCSATQKMYKYIHTHNFVLREKLTFKMTRRLNDRSWHWGALKSQPVFISALISALYPICATRGPTRGTE